MGAGPIAFWEIDMKYCSYGGHEAPRDHFYRDAGSRDGLQAMCIRCHAHYSAQRRTTNPQHPKYGRYGGRGITFNITIADWLAIPGWRPGLEIDRVDNNRGYEPGNLRWATESENSQNREISIRIGLRYGTFVVHALVPGVDGQLRALIVCDCSQTRLILSYNVRLYAVRGTCGGGAAHRAGMATR